MSTPRTRRQRALLGLGCAAAILLSLLPALDLHANGEPLDEHLPGAAQEIYYPSASHPGARPHLDAAHTAVRPLCPACLHRMQTAGADAPPLVAIAAPDAVVVRVAVERSALLVGDGHSAGARAPPVS
jgi:hypothetical protein